VQKKQCSVCGSVDHCYRFRSESDPRSWLHHLRAMFSSMASSSISDTALNATAKAGLWVRRAWRSSSGCSRKMYLTTRSRDEGLQHYAEERRAIAKFITGKKLGQEAEDNKMLAARCTDHSRRFDPLSGPYWNEWGAGLTNTRFQPAEEARITSEQVSELRGNGLSGFFPIRCCRSPWSLAGACLLAL
jgi:hypothetical protein